MNTVGIGIQICGLNGCGKSTLGRALAEQIGFHFIDNENLYFDRKKQNEPYENPRSQDEIEKLLRNEVKAHPDFVFAAVRGNYGRDILPLYCYVFLMKAPREIRLQRVRNRSYQKFGSRMLPGGDLYEQEEAFFRIIAARQEDYAESWLQSIKCPVIQLDGTKPVDENVAFILRTISEVQNRE